MKRLDIEFNRTRTKKCSTGELIEDEIAARQGAIVVAKMKWTSQPTGFDDWQVEWAAHSVNQKDIEQVLSKLVELNKEKANAE